MDALHHLLYTSIIAPGFGPGCVVDIVRVARSRNRALDITGVLVFDGWRFLQYVEGPQRSIAALTASLRTDPRHAGMIVLLDGPAPGPRRFNDWSMGYATSGDDELLLRFGAERSAPPELMGAFSRLLLEVDMEP